MMQAFKRFRKGVRSPLAAVLTVLLLAQPAHAQWNMDDLLAQMNDFNGMVSRFCDTAGQAGNHIDFGDSITSSVTWLCALQPSITRARDMAEGLSHDVTGFFTGAIGSGFSSLMDAVGFELGDTDLGGLIQESIGDISSGDFSFQAITGRLLERVNRETLANLTAPPDAAAPELEKRAVNAARADPVRLDREVEAMERRSQSMLQSAKAQDTSNIAQQFAATSLARGDEEKLVERVTNPSPVQGSRGTADVAQDRGRDANSTRAAVQAMVQAQADYMRQDAISTANIVTALKEQAMQQVFTTQQVGMLAKSLAEEQLRDYNEWREDYYSELGEALAKAENLRSNYAVVTELLGGE